jgi:aryl-alcohol dehydrogenase-like predicted oxidoreductase
VLGWTIDQAQSFQILDAFVAAGGNFIDTADVYSIWVPGHQGGESETILGNWLKQRHNRDQVIVATKVGMDMREKGKGLSRQHIQQSVEDSLKRLQTDYIDLYQSHQDDENTSLEETLATYANLMDQGKIRVIGASNYSATRLAEALQVSQQQGYPRYESLQPLYNLYDRAAFERDLEPLCQQEEMGVISYFSLASGFLSGKYRSKQDLAGRSRGNMVEKYLNHRGLQILDALDEVAKQYQATPTAVALAWLIARPSITAPIVSATTLEQLNEVIKATELQLTSNAIELLEHTSAELV